MSRRSRRKKHIDHAKKPTAEQLAARTKKAVIIGSAVVLAIVAAVVILYLVSAGKKDDALASFDKKAELLREQVLSDKRSDEISGDIEEGLPDNVVFLSVCSGEERAKVFTGTGVDRKAAWLSAYNQAKSFIENENYNAIWLKADLMSEAKTYDTVEFSTELHHYRPEFFRYGIAFDKSFETAILEAELNGAKILDYENECVDESYLNTYLKKAGRSTLSSLPDSYVVFKCVGWMCDENDEVYDLISDIDDYGRRKVDTVDKEYAAELVKNASGFLIDQVKDDGSFVYGYYPRFDKNIDNYNIVRHASTLWSLVCQYRMTGNEELVPVIDRAIDYMVENAIVERNDEISYLYEEKSDEIKLGGCGVAVVALHRHREVRAAVAALPRKGEPGLFEPGSLAVGDHPVGVRLDADDHLLAVVGQTARVGAVIGGVGFQIDIVERLVVVGAGAECRQQQHGGDARQVCLQFFHRLLAFTGSRSARTPWDATSSRCICCRNGRSPRS